MSLGIGGWENDEIARGSEIRSWCKWILGLLFEQNEVSLFVLDHELPKTEEYTDYMEFMDDMDGSRFSNVEANVNEYQFRPATWETLGSLLTEYETIIPF